MSSIERYAFNLFAYPEGYFEKHSAKQLKISEKDRQKLIELARPESDEEYDKAVKKRHEEMERKFHLKKDGGPGNPGSGNHNHAGVPGEQGGSAPGNGSRRAVDGKDLRDTYTGPYDTKSVIKAQGFDGLPKLAGYDDFQRAVHLNNFVAQRTYSATSEEILEQYHNELFNGDFYISGKGNSAYGEGMYAAANYEGELTTESEMEYYKGLNSENLYWQTKCDYVANLSIDEIRNDPAVKDYNITEDEAKVFQKLNATTTPSLVDLTAEERKAEYGMMDTGSWQALVNATNDKVDSYLKKNPIPSKVETFTLDADASIITYDDLTKEWVHATNSEKYNGIDKGAYAALRGYDAIRVESPLLDYEYTVILNRTKCMFYDDSMDYDTDGKYTITFERGENGLIKAIRDGKVIGYVKESVAEDDSRKDGGPRSGNHGHAGVPGVQGGSAPQGSSSSEAQEKFSKALKEEKDKVLAGDNDSKAKTMVERGFLTSEQAQKAIDDGSIDKKVEQYYAIMEDNGNTVSEKPLSDNDGDEWQNKIGTEYSGISAMRTAFIEENAPDLTDEQVKAANECMEDWTADSFHANSAYETAARDAFIENDHTYDGEIYRGLSFVTVHGYDDFMEGVEPGAVISVASGTHNASWSSDEEIAESFAEVDEDGTDSVIIRCVENRTSSPISALSKFPDEYEVISHSKAQWTVLNVDEFEKDDGGRQAEITVVERGTYISNSNNDAADAGNTKRKSSKHKKEPTIYDRWKASSDDFQVVSGPHYDGGPGNPGSGNHNHAGVPGEQGGSAPGNGSREPHDGKDLRDSYKPPYRFKEILQAQGYDGLPKVVGKKDFKKAVKESGMVAQRTYAASSQEILDQYQNELYNGDFYVECSGGSLFGQGMYSISNYKGNLTKNMQKYIADYADANEWDYREPGDTPVSAIETFTLDPSAKVITDSDAQKEMRQAGFSMDVGAYAALAGYDAVQIPNACGKDSYTIVVNRSKCIFYNEKADEYAADSKYAITFERGKDGIINAIRDGKIIGWVKDLALKDNSHADGGPRSGNHGHAGVPGTRGGSAPGNGSREVVEGKDITASYNGDTHDIKAVLKAQGFDGLPKVVSKDEFEEAAKESNIVGQRTYSATSEEILEQYQNALYNGEFYVECTGGNACGKGMYCATCDDSTVSTDIKIEMADYQELQLNEFDQTCKSEVLSSMTADKLSELSNTTKDEADLWLYAYSHGTFDLTGEQGDKYDELKSNGKWNDMANVMQDALDEKMANSSFSSVTETVTLDKSAKVGNYMEVFMAQANEKEPWLSADIGVYAAAKGYDAIKRPTRVDGLDYTVVLNRTKLIIQDNTLNMDSADGKYTITFEPSEETEGLVIAKRDGKEIGWVRVGMPKNGGKPMKKNDRKDGFSSAVIVLKDGEMLTGTRQKGSHKGEICGPGGHCENGESPKHAAIRECKEEFGITPEDLTLLGYGPKEKNGLRPVIYIATNYKGRPKSNDGEMKDVSFRSMEELEGMKLFQPFSDSLDLMNETVNDIPFDSRTDGILSPDFLKEGFNKMSEKGDKPSNLLDKSAKNDIIEIEGGGYREAFESLSDEDLNFLGDEFGLTPEEILSAPDDILKVFYDAICVGGLSLDADTDDYIEDPEWISTENGNHIPLNAEGTAVSGPFKGQNFANALACAHATKPEVIKKAAEGMAAKAKSGDKTPPMIDTPEAKKFLEDVENGNVDVSKLADSPIIKQLDAISDYWSTVYPDDPSLDASRDPERQKWLNEFLSTGSKNPVLDENGEQVLKNGKPQYTDDGEITKGYEAEIVIGLPASGKSSTIVDKDSAEMGAFILDSDELKEKITEFKESGGGAANVVHNESKNLNKEAMATFTSGDRTGDNLVIPIIGDDYDKVMSKYIEPLESAGYKVNIKYKATDPDDSLVRNVVRAINTGRVIPSNVSLGYGNKPEEVYNKFAEEGKYVCERVG